MPDLIPVSELSEDRVLEVTNRGSDEKHSYCTKIISATQNLGKSIAGGSGGVYPSSTIVAKVTPKPMIFKVELVGDKYLITIHSGNVMSYLTIIKLSMAVRLEDLPVISDSSNIFNEIAKARLEHVKMDFYNTSIDLKIS